MRISDVKQEDGRKCAQLVNLLKEGRWELSGPDIMAHTETVAWVHNLARMLAEQLKQTMPPANPAPAADTSVKIKGSGPISKKPSKKSK